MKRIIIFGLVLLFFLWNRYEFEFIQPQLTYELIKTQSFNNSTKNLTFLVGAESSDNNLIISGNYIENNLPGQGFILKYNRTGNLIWETLLSEDVTINSIIVNESIVGVGSIKINARIHPYFIRLDESGNIINTNTLSIYPYAVLNSVVESNDGGYIATGYSDYPRDGLIIKFDQNGLVLSQKTFGGEGNDAFYQVIKTSNQEFITVGYTESDNDDITDGLYGYRDGLIVKFSESGEIIWNKTMGSRDLDELYSLVEQEPDIFFTVGTSHNYRGTNSLLIKFDTKGEMIYKKDYYTSFSEHFYQVLMTDDNNLLISGISYDMEMTTSNQKLTLIDINGNILNSLRTDEAGFIFRTKDNKYVAISFNLFAIIEIIINEINN